MLFLYSADDHGCLVEYEEWIHKLKAEVAVMPS